MIQGFLGLVALLVMAGASQSALPTEAEFLAADDKTKGRALTRILSRDSSFSIEAAITLIELGIRDGAPLVRVAALSVISARATMARWAGTPGPSVGPGPQPRRQLEDIPLEWKDDQRKLRSALYADCVRLLQRDPDRDVRLSALRAVGNLAMPANRDEPFPDEFIALPVDRYHKESDPRVRAAVVGNLRLMPNDSESVRAVLRVGLVDPQAPVRSAALAAIGPQASRGRPRLSFEEARSTLETSLKAADAGVRLGAVQALNVFGAPSAPYLPVLERMRQTDADAQVRTSAQLAIEAIERALKPEPRK